jgi:hypothetical protein
MRSPMGTEQHASMALVGPKEPQMRKPAQHVVMSFVSADDATAAVLLLHELGLAGTDVTSYTPEQMRMRAAAILDRTCQPTAPGSEPELVITQRELARRGHSFVLARAGSATLLQRICRVAAETQAYGVQAVASARQPTASSAPTGRWQTAARPSTSP